MPASIEQDAVAWLESRGVPVFGGNIRNAIEFLSANPERRPSYNPAIQSHWAAGNNTGTMPSAEDQIMSDVMAQEIGPQRPPQSSPMDINNPPTPSQRPDTPQNMQSNPPVPGQRPPVPENIRTQPPIPGQRPQTPERIDPASNPAFGADDISDMQPQSTMDTNGVDRMPMDMPQSQGSVPQVSDYVPGQTSAPVSTSSGQLNDPNNTWQQRIANEGMSYLDMLMDELSGAAPSSGGNTPQVDDQMSARIAPGAQAQRFDEQRREDDNTTQIPIVPPAARRPQLPATTSDSRSTPTASSDIASSDITTSTQRTDDILNLTGPEELNEQGRTSTSNVMETSPQAYRDAFDAAAMADNPREAALNFFAFADENPSMQSPEVIKELQDLIRERFGGDLRSANEAIRAGMESQDNPVEAGNRRNQILQLMRRGLR